MKMQSFVILVAYCLCCIVFALWKMTTQFHLPSEQMFLMHFCCFFASKMIPYCPSDGRLPATAPSFLQHLCSCNTTQDHKGKNQCSPVQLKFPSWLIQGRVSPSKSKTEFEPKRMISDVHTLPQCHSCSGIFQLTMIPNQFNYYFQIHLYFVAGSKVLWFESWCKVFTVLINRFTSSMNLTQGCTHYPTLASLYCWEGKG